MKPFTTTAVALFAFIAVAHVIRLATGWEVIVNGFAVPVWFSLPGLASLQWSGVSHAREPRCGAAVVNGPVATAT